MLVHLMLFAYAFSLSLKSDDGKLSGVITDEAGKPIKGALVSIDAAGPKVGVGYMCPGCYKDCGKTSTTDAQGRYALEKLDSEFRFRLLIAAEGYVAKTTLKGLDPLEPVAAISLKKSNLENRDASLIVRGKVVNEKGEPVQNATLTPRGRKVERGIRFGGNDDVDPMVCTNANGEFAFAVPTNDTAFSFTVKARTFATTVTSMLPPGKSDNTVRLETGVTVVGKVTKGGKPVPNFALGLVPQDRNAQTFTGDAKIETDKSGQFRFDNVPANTAYSVYGLMQATNKVGLVRARDLETGASGTTCKIGALAILKGYSLIGRVLLPNGKPVPAGTPVAVGRNDAWDVKKTETDGDGGFEFQGLPAEKITIWAVLKGYYVAKNQPGVDEMSPSTARINLTGDIMGYLLRLEPELPERTAISTGHKPSTNHVPPRVMVKEPTPLDDALGDFNQQSQRHSIGNSQPPLTEDEIVATIRAWDGENKQLAAELRPLFHAIVESRELPASTGIGVVTTTWSGKYRYDLWRVSMTLVVPASLRQSNPQLPRVASMVIRHQMIHSYPRLKEEIEMSAKEQAMLKEYLEKRKQAKQKQSGKTDQDSKSPSESPKR